MSSYWTGPVKASYPYVFCSTKRTNSAFGAQKETLSRLQQRYADHVTASFQTFSATRGEGKAALIEQLLDWLKTPVGNEPNDSPHRV